MAMTKRAHWIGAALWLAAAGCDDPATDPAGAVVLLFRVTPSDPGSPQDDLASATIRYDRIEAVVDGTQVVVDSQLREIVLDNTANDTLVAQLPVPPGTLDQLRIFGTEVVLTERDGDVVTLLPGTSDLPSWENSGWKIVPADGVGFPVVEGAFTGVRALFSYDDRFVGTGHARWKLKPTVPAEPFDANPADHAPGVPLDAFTWVVEPGVDAADVQAIAASLGCTVARAPVLSRWWRIQLPVTLNLELAEAAFRPLIETAQILPAMNYGLHTVTADDADQPAYDIVNAEQGWCDASTADPNGFVGSHWIRVADIEGPIDVTHPDLRRNIGIKQLELPRGLFDADADGAISAAEIAAHDCDPDGLITIRDLECDPAIAPADLNGNGAVDAQDVVMDPAWADSVDDDGNGLVDDLCGWDFASDDNDPSHPLTEIGDTHATFVSGIIGAEGNTGSGIAGMSWRVSIVPIQSGFFDTSSGEFYAPHESLADAFAYVEAEQLDVANMSMGWLFESEDGDDARGCGDENYPQVTKGIDSDDYDDGVQQWQDAMDDLFTGTGTTLYAISAGNSSYDVTSAENFSVPYEAMFADVDVASRLLAVGAVDADGSEKAGFSSYGASVEIYAPGELYTSLIPTIDTCDVTTGCSQAGCPSSGSTVVCDSDGTSFASPTVAGAAALLAAADPTVRGDGAALKSALLATANVVPDLVTCDGSATPGALLDLGALVPP